ncbi:MAG: aminopeptidase [Clostridia bacterium]
MDKQKLKNYAKLILDVGINIQKDDILVISASVDGLELAKLITKYAYKLGAKRVELMFNDEEFTRLQYKYQTEEQSLELDPWYIDQRNSIADRKACYIGILSENPDAFADVNPQLLAEISAKKHKLLTKYYEGATSNSFRWCLCATPCASWAHKLFPSASESDALDNLWHMIFKTMRLDANNPVDAWKQHINKLSSLCAIINDYQFAELRYSNSLGTNLTVGLPQDYVFTGGHELSRDGVEFTANMPTEEIFTSPDRNKVNGKVFSSMPLIHNGGMVDEFCLEFKDGRIVNYTAKVGFEILKGIIETDEGSHYIGEAALVQFNSPIRKLDTLFYNTLFDENASCHLAIGDSYLTIKGADKMTKEQLAERGLNTSASHVDFMIGTQDMSIIGVTKDGKEVAIFKDGNFAI